MRVFRVALVLSTLSVSACDKYMLQSNSVGTESTPQPGQSAFPKSARTEDLYNTVRISSEPARNTTLDACATSFFLSTIRTEQRNIVFSAILPAEGGSPATPIPIYAASKGGNSSCLIDYNDRVIIPRERFSPAAYKNIDATYLYGSTSEENVSGYLTAAVALASTIAAGGNPVIGAASDFLATAAAANLRQAANAAMRSRVNIGRPLVTLAGDNASPTWFQQTANYQIQSVRHNQNFQPYNEPPTALANIKVTVTRRLSVLGQVQDGSPPDYSALNRTTQVLVLIPTAAGHQPANKNLYDLVNTDAFLGVADGVSQLGSEGVSQKNVKDACDRLRNGLTTVGLNRWDVTAYLWRVYSWSDYARVKETTQGARKSPCLNSDEIKIINELGITGWPAEGRS